MHTDDIYSRLLAGENAEDLAKAFTDELNAAQARIAEEAARKAEEEARVAAEKAAHTKAKREAAADILADILAFCATYYPSFGLTLNDKVSDDELYSLVDLILMLMDLEVKYPSKHKISIKSPKTRDQDSDKPLTTNDIFADAFKMFGL